jgi:hypothetical protein
LSADAEDEHEGVIRGERAGLGESGAGRLAGVHGAGQVFTLSRDVADCGRPVRGCGDVHAVAGIGACQGAGWLLDQPPGAAVSSCPAVMMLTTCHGGSAASCPAGSVTRSRCSSSRR